MRMEVCDMTAGGIHGSRRYDADVKRFPNLKIHRGCVHDWAERQAAAEGRGGGFRSSIKLIGCSGGEEERL